VDKRSRRQRRAGKTRARIALQDIHRLCVHRTPKHIYAQIIAPDRATVVATASTVQKSLREGLKSTGNKEAAAAVGKAIAAPAAEKGVTKVAFDRSGNRFRPALAADDDVENHRAARRDREFWESHRAAVDGRRRGERDVRLDRLAQLRRQHGAVGGEAHRDRLGDLLCRQIELAPIEQAEPDEFDAFRRRRPLPR